MRDGEQKAKTQHVV